MTAYLEKIPNMIRELPAISPTTLSIMRYAASSDRDTDKLSRMIETDVSLASRCLQIVNSAAYGLKSKVDSIKRAIILMGAETVTQVALQIGVGRIMNRQLDGYESDNEALWRNGLRTAIASRNLARNVLNLEDPDAAYATGLLHDIGKIILSEFLTEKADQVKAVLEHNAPSNFSELESELFGSNHAQVGSEIAEHWGLPETIIAGIRWHHKPAEAPEHLQKLVICIHLGDIFAMMSGSGTQLDAMAYTVDPIVAEYIKQDATWELKTFPKLLLDIDSEFQEAMALSVGGAHD